MFETVVQVHTESTSTPSTERIASSSECCSSSDESITSSIESPSCSTNEVESIDNAKDDSREYRATPLSTREVLGIVAFLAIFSFIYLAYAQHHKTLFYVMTSLIALWIMFIYTAGILSVFYMVIVGYEQKPQSDDDDVEKNGVNDSKQQESNL
ncbi:hypothetical protein V3C99_007225 [Haemonchus contortus]